MGKTDFEALNSLRLHDFSIIAVRQVKERVEIDVGLDDGPPHFTIVGIDPTFVNVAGPIGIEVDKAVASDYHPLIAQTIGHAYIFDLQWQHPDERSEGMLFPLQQYASLELLPQDGIGPAHLTLVAEEISVHWHDLSSPAKPN